MNIKEAVSTALHYVQDIFALEEVKHLGLEEIEYDSEKGEWVITVGFSRPWDIAKGTVGMVGTGPQLNRTYKTLRVRDSNGEVSSINIRTT